MKCFILSTTTVQKNKITKMKNIFFNFFNVVSGVSQIMLNNIQSKTKFNMNIFKEAENVLIRHQN